MRREERDRLVAPVVRPAWRRRLRIELEHRQELHGGDAQILEIRNLLDQSGVGSARRGGDARARMPGEAAHVQLVDHRLDERADRRGASPSQSYAPGSATTLFIAVAAFGAGPARGLAVVRIRNGDDEPVRIEQHLLAVEAQAAFRRERPVRPVAVDLARAEARHEGMPVVVGAVLVRGERDDARRAARRRRRRTAAARSAWRGSRTR